MTEAEWLACADPWELLRFRWTKRRSGRKLRLFAVACCRRGWDLLADPRSRHAVEAHELYADKRIDKRALEAADAGAAAVVTEGGFDGMSPNAANQAAWAVMRLQNDRRADLATSVMSYAVAGESFLHAEEAEQVEVEFDDPYWYTFFFHPSRVKERKVQADLFRDVFGNPFRPTATDPAWLAWNDGTVAKLAEAIYQSKDFDRMPILADALEEAGCIDPEILDHCRREGGHVRGCWVLDSLLGRR